MESRQSKAEASTVTRIELTVNGQRHVIDVEARKLLADLLRVELGFTGTHVSCAQGACGVCTVLVNGRVIRSCLTLAVQADGTVIHTIEGLVNDPVMCELRQAFHEHHALQCGFCTAGFLVSACALLSSRPDATRSEITADLEGLLCRCGGYGGISAAVLAAQEKLSTR